MIHNPVRKQLPALSNPGAAGDLRSGKQLVGADGSVVSGALAEVQQAVPTISVSSGGLITASAKQSGGIIAAGSESATQQLPTQGAATITPGTTEQIAVPTQTYTTGAVKVAGDANLAPENIAEGVSIFGVNGLLPQLNLFSSGFKLATDSRLSRVGDNQFRVILTLKDSVPSTTYRPLAGQFRMYGSYNNAGYLVVAFCADSYSGWYNFTDTGAVYFYDGTDSVIVEPYSQNQVKVTLKRMLSSIPLEAFTQGSVMVYGESGFYATY